MSSNEPRAVDQLLAVMYEADTLVRVDLAEAIVAEGWRPPPRRIETVEELDALPGRAIVVGNRGKFGTAWQLTSHEVWPNPGANWGSPFLQSDRYTSRQLLEHEGSVTVLWEGDPMSWHVGRSFSGHPLEDECPCPKEPCGLVRLENAHPDCEQHPNKTLRQGHRADQCPATPGRTDA
ncbi:hypothetical protein ACIBQ0_17025 [Nocardia nova]|uniref:hypothetical protein n=1 Tax=Nocardia nova TaxID=37330 RepID=UPI00378D16EF